MERGPSSAPLLSDSDIDSDSAMQPPSYNSVAGSRETSPENYLRKRLTVDHFKHSYSIRSFFTVKPIEAFMEGREKKKEGGGLAQKLGLIDLLGYGVGCTVGAGIYSLIGVGAGIAGAVTVVCLLLLIDNNFL